MTISYKRINVGGFLVYESICAAGAKQLYRVDTPVAKADLPNALVFTKGRYSYGPFPGIGNVVLTPGMTSADLPDRPAGELVMEALEDGSEYFCINPVVSGQKVVGTPLSLAPGQSLEVPALALAVVTGDAYLVNGAPKSGTRLLYARSGGLRIDAQGACLGLVATLAEVTVVGQPPVRTAQMARAEKLAALAALRYQKETGGITLAGVAVRTDRESQAQLNGAYVSLKEGLIPDTPWKAANGWMPLTFADIAPIAQAVAAHVRACFAAERAHAQAIAQLPDDVAALDGYDISTGWPA